MSARIRDIVFQGLEIWLGCIVFLPRSLMSFLAFCLPSRFSHPCLRHLSSTFSFYPVILLFPPPGFPRRALKSLERNPRFILLHFFFFFFLIFSFFSSPLYVLYLTPISLPTLRAFSCLANGEEPKKLSRLRTSRVYTPSTLARLSSERLFFSLRYAVKSFLAWNFLKT